MKISLTTRGAVGAVMALSACENDATPAQEQQVEALDEQADALEAGDVPAQMPQ